MSKVLKVVGMVAGAVALVATGVGAFAAAGSALAATASTVASVATVVSGVAGVISSVVGQGAKVQAEQTPARGSVSRVVTEINAPQPYVMGEGFFAGVLRHDAGYGATLNDVPNPYRGMVIVYSGAGPIESITPWLEYAPITNYYDTFLYTDTQLGATPEASALTAHFSGFPDWTTDHKLSGQAAILWNLKFDKAGKRFASGIPVIGAYGQWVKVYDPRLDSTFPGGSGTQRLNDEATWAYSDNPALHAGTYAYGRYQNGKKVMGIGLPEPAIDFAAVAAWANLCDANSWTMFGVAWEPGNRWVNLKDICFAGGGEPTFSNGVLSFAYAAPVVALDTVTEADLIGECSVTSMQSYRDRINTIVPSYRSPEHNWEMIQAEQIQSATYLTEDGEEKRREWTFNFVKNKDQAAELGAYKMVNSRELAPITLECGPRLRAYRPGECLALNIPELGLDTDAIILKRTVDPGSMKVTLTFIGETPSKHAYALGQVGVAPPTPSLSQTLQERDEVAAAVAIGQDGADGADGAPGADGSDGLNSATVYLYRRSASAPTLPTANVTYTFSTGVATGLTQGWTQTIPAGTDPLYVTVASAVSTSPSDVIAPGEWSGAVVLAQDGSDGSDGSDGAAGSDGADGLNVATVFLYQRAASAPALINNSTTFTFATGVLSGSLDGWSQTVPDANGFPLWVTTATASNTSATDSIGSGEWAAASIMAEDGVDRGAIERHFDYATVDDFLAEWTRNGTLPDLSMETGDPNVSGGTSLQIGNNSGNDEGWYRLNDGNPFPVEPNILYEVEWVSRRTQGSGLTYLGVCGLAADKTTLVNTSGAASMSSQHYFAAAAVDIGGTWQRRVGYFTTDGTNGSNNTTDPDNPGGLHPDVRYVTPMFLVNYSDQAGISEVAYCRVRKSPLNDTTNMRSDLFTDLDDWEVYSGSPTIAANNNRLEQTQAAVNANERTRYKPYIDMSRPWAMAFHLHLPSQLNGQLGMKLDDGTNNTTYLRLAYISGAWKLQQAYSSAPLLADNVEFDNRWLIVGDGEGEITIYIGPNKVYSGLDKDGLPWPTDVKGRVAFQTEFAVVGEVGGLSDFVVASGQNASDALRTMYLTETGADRTRSVSGTGEIIVEADSGGTVKSGQLGTRGSFKLTPAGGAALTSGVSWSLTVVSGSWSGTAASISGSGTGALNIASAPNGTVELDITATYNGKAYPPFRCKVRKVNDVAVPQGDTEASTTDLADVNSTSWTEVCRMEVTTPASAGDVNLTADSITVNHNRDSQLWAGGNFELKWQRSNAGANSWGDIGSAASSNPDPYTAEITPPPGAIYEAVPGSITCNRTNTTAANSTAYDYRLLGRWSASGHPTAFLSGTASVEAT